MGRQCNADRAIIAITPANWKTIWRDFRQTGRPLNTLENFHMYPLAFRFSMHWSARKLRLAGVNRECEVQRVPGALHVFGWSRFAFMPDVISDDCTGHAKLNIGFQI